MTEAEVEDVVVETVRRYTLNDGVTAASRFEADLRLSEAGRQMLFASLAQAFAARGVGLPSQGFYLTDFLACPTPAAAGAAIRAKVFGTTPTPASGRDAPAREEVSKKKPKAKTGTPKSVKKSVGTPKKASPRKSGPSRRKPGRRSR